MKGKNKKRKDGRIQTKVYLGMIDGNKKYKYIYASNQKELDKKVLEIKLSLNKGIDISAQYDTFGEWTEQWLKLKRIEISDKKYKSYVYKKIICKSLV